MPASDQGVLANRYTLTPRTLIFLTHGEHILLLKGAPHKRLWANRYNGIGGHIERGEDILDAACRELNEETGLSSIELRLCGVVSIDTGQDIGVGLYIFTGRLPAGQDAPSLAGDPNEGSLEWVHHRQIHRLPLVEDLPTLLPHILALQPGEAPFSAHYRYDNDGRLQIAFGGKQHG